MYSVYMHICPNNKRYIGMTRQNPKCRWNNGKHYICNKEFYNDILKYGWNNIKHIIIENHLTYDEASQLEQETIKKFQTTNKKYGYNKSIGGKYSRNGIKNLHYNIKNNNPASRKVLCVELNVIFNTMTDAKEQLDVDVSAITKCCKGKRHTTGGYHWQYI